MTGQKEPLTIVRCNVSKEGTVSEEAGDDCKFEAMINPSEFKHSHSIAYAGAGKDDEKAEDDKPMGRTGSETRFAGVNAEDVSFSLVLDGTGVVASSKDSVNDQIAKLKKVTYDYVGKKHETPVVRISWGKLKLASTGQETSYFDGRLKSMGVTYTVFKPSGEPLRAKVSLGFVSFTTKKAQDAAANESSPDLSHLVTVRAGDTLPLLCHEIYRDTRQHLFVARANGLTSVRNLVPGTVLRFPPLA